MTMVLPAAKAARFRYPIRDNSVKITIDGQRNPAPIVSDPADNNTGWLLGAKLGRSKDRGQMQFTYYYADKAADAMLGLLTDSDFGGGGTDNKGHWMQVNYGVSKSWTIGAQYFINEIDLASGSKSDFNRFMIDTQWKWK